MGLSAVLGIVQHVQAFGVLCLCVCCMVASAVFRSFFKGGWEWEWGYGSRNKRGGEQQD